MCWELKSVDLLTSLIGTALSFPPSYKVKLVLEDGSFFYVICEPVNFVVCTECCEASALPLKLRVFYNMLSSPFL